MTSQTLAGDDVAAWAASGAMALTGERDGPPLAEPASAARAAASSATALAEATARWGRRVRVDGPALLGERAATAGLARQGSVSAGGSATFLGAADGWVVLNLPRPCDLEALPALVGAAIDPSQWELVARRLSAMPLETILERAGLLGLAVAAPPRWCGCAAAAAEQPAPDHPQRDAEGARDSGEESGVGVGAATLNRLSKGAASTGGAAQGPTASGEGFPAGVRWRECKDAMRRSRSPHPLVVDLTSLWAGPLAGSLLAEAGARVVKVEGSARPDGARRGPRVFFDLLNASKRCVAVDFESREGRRLLVSLMASADLVLEGSRPRVMDRLGIHPAELARSGTSWLSISGYGRSGPDAQRVAFGDDAAVAGGLLVDGPVPGFVADAVADPLAGLHAAAVAARMLASERASVAEVSLAGVAREAVGPPPSPAPQVIPDGPGWSVVVGGERVQVAEPRARPPTGAASEQGAHTAEVLAELRQEAAGHSPD